LQKNSKRPASPNESTQSKEVGHQLYSLMPPLIGPTPLLAKEQQGRSTAPAARSQPLRGQKTFPVGRAEDMPVCLFAQGPFASAEYLVQLTSSLAQKVCLARGSPCPPGEWLKSHITQPAEKRSFIMVIAEYTSPSGTAYRLIKEGSRVIAERQINEVWEEAGTYCGSDIYNAETAIVKIVSFMEDKNLYQLPWCAKPLPKIPSNPKLN